VLDADGARNTIDLGMGLEFADVEARRSGNDLTLNLKGSRNVRGRRLLSSSKSRRWRNGEQNLRAANDVQWRAVA